VTRVLSLAETLTSKPGATVAPFAGDVIATVGGVLSPGMAFAPSRSNSSATEFCLPRHDGEPAMPHARALSSPHSASWFWNERSPS